MSEHLVNLQFSTSPPVCRSKLKRHATIRYTQYTSFRFSSRPAIVVELCRPNLAHVNWHYCGVNVKVSRNSSFLWLKSRRRIFIKMQFVGLPAGGNLQNNSSFITIPTVFPISLHQKYKPLPRKITL